MGLNITDNEDSAIIIKARISEIENEFNQMLETVSEDTINTFDNEKATRLITQKNELENKLIEIEKENQTKLASKSRLNEICAVLDTLQNHPMEYDDNIVRKLIEYIIVESKNKIKIIFSGGYETEEFI